MGPLGQEASEFLTELGRRLSLITDDARETSHLFQHISLLIQRYNAVAFQGSFVEEDDDVSGELQTLFLTLFLTLGIFTTEGIKKK